jgi:hypothetical protein
MSEGEGKNYYSHRWGGLDPEFKMVDQMFIDLGELDECSREFSFVLGAEWGDFRRQCVGVDEEFEFIAHKISQMRLMAMAENNNRFAEIVDYRETTDGDPTDNYGNGGIEQWITIKVAAKSTNTRLEG